MLTRGIENLLIEYWSLLRIIFSKDSALQERQRLPNAVNSINGIRSALSHLAAAAEDPPALPPLTKGFINQNRLGQPGSPAL
jgi:hypothetical protein